MPRSLPVLLFMSATVAAGGLASASRVEAAPLPVSSFPGDPDAQWKNDLYQVLLSLNPTLDPNLDGANFSIPRDSNALPAPMMRIDQLVGSAGPYTAQEQDAIEQAWLLEEGTGPWLQILNLPDVAFTLPFIEGTWGTSMHAVNVSNHVVQPITYAAAGASFGFLYSWDYATWHPTPGNPYFADRGILHRAMSVIGLELIMIDQMHKTRDNADPTKYVLAAQTSNPGGYQAFYIDPSCYMAGFNGDQPPESGHNPNPGGPAPAQCTTTHLRNGQSSSYNFALTLNDLAHEYLAIRDGLSPQERAPYDAAFLRLGNRLAVWGPEVLHANRTLPGAEALFIVQHIWGGMAAQHPVEANQAATDYKAYVSKLFTPGAMFDRGGFFWDDYGWDASYNRINFTHVGRLARMEEVLGPTPMQPLILSALEDMWRTRSHMTIVDPDGVGGFRYAPNHFNSRTGGGVVWGQGLQTTNAFDALTFGIDGAYAELRGWDPTNYDQFNGAGSSSYLNGKKKGVVNTNLSAAIAPPSVWSPGQSGPYAGVQGWTEYAGGYYTPAVSSKLWQPGLFAQWDADLQTPETDLYPQERSGDGFQKLDDDFVWLKLGNMTAMIHTGKISKYEQGGSGQVGGLPGGYGGGMLSYLHDKDGGGMMLSRRRTRYPTGTAQTQSELMDNWDQWDRWSLHNVWLSNPSGGLTQSARILNPSESIQTSGGTPQAPQSVVVTVEGDIPASNGRWGNVLQAPVEYRRTFSARADEMTIKTTLNATSTNEWLNDLVETIPLNGLGYRNQGMRMRQAGQPWEDIRITMRLQNGTSVDGIQNADVYYNNVVSVVYERLGGTMEVRMAQPSRVKITPPYHHWYVYSPGVADGQLTVPTDPTSAPSQSLLKTRNIVIDLLGNAGTQVPRQLTNASIGYTITLY